MIWPSNRHVLAAVLCGTVLSTSCAGSPGSGADSGESTATTAGSAASASAPRDQGVIEESFEVVREFPHDPGAFTQGLVFHGGHLYEGTGRRGQSTLRKVEIETGNVLERVTLNPMQFGEGIAIHDGRIYQLTWTSGIGYVYDLDTLAVQRQFRQFTQGWGLTTDGRELILSDGSAKLYFVDPETMQPTRNIEVRDENGPVPQLNELEYIDGEIYANVWHSWDILRISPRDGRVIGRIDMRGIFDTATLSDGEAVLNGIAYDPATGRVFVTGKLWPTLFEVRFVRR